MMSKRSGLVIFGCAAYAGESVQYLVDGGTVQECHVVKKKYSSWFIDDSVIADGSLYIWTPVDILFLLLPALEKSRSQGTFCSIDHVVECMDCGQDGYRLMSIIDRQKDKIKSICEWKENGGDIYFKLDDDKVVSWLVKKVRRLEAALKEKDKAFEALDEKALAGYASGIVAEYISDAWNSMLHKSLGVDLPTEGSKEEAVHSIDATIEQYHSSKKPKLDKKDIAKARQMEAKREAKAKQLAKETAGMKKMSSFFAVKKKEN